MSVKRIYYGTINVSKLVEEVKKGNPAVYKSDKTGDLYLNVNVFCSDELDKFGFNGAISNSVQENDKDKRFYLGNIKLSKRNEVDKKDLDSISL